MSVPPALLQFLGSLAAIFVLAGVAWHLKLGAGSKLADDTAAREAANHAVNGFEAMHIAVAHDGTGAILQDATGAILVLKQHGSHFAGRILGPVASARLSVDGEQETLTVVTGEKRFGEVRLVIDDARLWASRIDGIGRSRNA